MLVKYIGLWPVGSCFIGLSLSFSGSPEDGLLTLSASA